MVVKQKLPIYFRWACKGDESSTGHSPYVVVVAAYVTGLLSLPFPLHLGLQLAIKLTTLKLTVTRSPLTLQVHHEVQEP